MKPRKVKEIQRVLEKKGFVLEPKKDDHNFYYLSLNGKKHSIYTYISHGSKEYDKNLMAQIKKQLKFTDISKAEDFFDCTLDGEQYVEMLIDSGEILKKSPLLK